MFTIHHHTTEERKIQRTWGNQNFIYILCSFYIYIYRFMCVCFIQFYDINIFLLFHIIMFLMLLLLLNFIQNYATILFYFVQKFNYKMIFGSHENGVHFVLCVWKRTQEIHKDKRAHKYLSFSSFFHYIVACFIIYLSFVLVFCNIKL